jgi:hypothetical protein
MIFGFAEMLWLVAGTVYDQATVVCVRTRRPARMREFFMPDTMHFKAFSSSVVLFHEKCEIGGKSWHFPLASGEHE